MAPGIHINDVETNSSPTSTEGTDGLVLKPDRGKSPQLPLFGGADGLNAEAISIA